MSRRDAARMKKALIRGHNGLRNRIAERMFVANMVEMVCFLKQKTKKQKIKALAFGK